MNFFNASFFKIPDTSNNPPQDVDPSPSSPNQTSGAWGFGGLVKSLALKSEEILQTYGKDLQEFGSGLKKESGAIADVAAYAVKDLPTSLESGASVAQESLESVGQAIEDFGSSVWRGTAEILAQGKDAVLRADDPEDSAASASSLPRYENTSISGGKYSRFEAQVSAMQHDSSTYCDEPDDAEDYKAWQSTFNLEEKKQDIDSTLDDNTFFQELFGRFVPGVVTYETFWMRYFYRLHKLHQTEEARVDLVKRATAAEEEDLGWDTEEEPDDGEPVRDGGRFEDKEIQSSQRVIPNSEIEQLNQGGSEIMCREDPRDRKGGNFVEKSLDTGDHGAKVEATLDEGDDLGWEVAEDFEESTGNDEKKMSSSSETSWEVPEVPRDSIKRRVVAHDEEEDLSWDVDDGDDDAKP